MDFYLPFLFWNKSFLLLLALFLLALSVKLLETVFTFFVLQLKVDFQSILTFITDANVTCSC